MSTVFVYAGQGAQHVGMGKDFYDTYPEFKSFIDNLNVGIDLKKLMFEGPIEELSKTENTQASMAAFAAGITKLLETRNVKPDVACGLSLGEYGALYAAGVYDKNEYVKLTAYRGKVMMEAAKGISCSMSAVLGMDAKLIEAECEAYSGDGFVTVANYNCPGQIVICGDEDAVIKVEEGLKDKGAKRCVRLNVSGPYHTKYMEPAGEALSEYFKNMEFKKPSIPVLLNVTGDYLKDEDLKENLVKQVKSGVRFESELRTLLNDGYTDFVEIGPGNTIAGFLKKTAKAMEKEISVLSIDTVEDFKKVVGE